MDILGWFRSNNFESIKNLFELFSYFATLGGLWVIFLTVKSFKKSVEDTQKSEQSQLMDKSMEVLGTFADEIIPGMSDYYINCQNKFDEVLKGYNKQVIDEGGEPLKEFPKELIEKTKLQVQLESRGGDVLNKLERVSAYISHELVLDDVVYPAVHKVFLEFYEDNLELIKKVTSEEAPYANLHSVYTKWRAEADKQSLDREQEDLDIRKKKLEDKRARLIKK